MQSNLDLFTRPVDVPPLPRVLLQAVLTAFALSALVFAANWRYGYNMGDEGWAWHLSQLVLDGTLPVRDHFSYDPGRYLWVAAWFKAAGADGIFWWRAAGAAFGALGLACACGSMHWARLPLAARILFTLLLAMALAYPRHKVYEQSWSLIATAALFVALLRAGTKSWFCLGLVTGVARYFGAQLGTLLLPRCVRGPCAARAALRIKELSTGRPCVLRRGARRLPSDVAVVRLRPRLRQCDDRLGALHLGLADTVADPLSLACAADVGVCGRLCRQSLLHGCR